MSLTSALACAQPMSAQASCDVSAQTQSDLQCLHTQMERADAALQQSLTPLSALLPAPQNAQLQTQQRDWLQRSDQECTPKHQAASDSNALAQAALCRTRMSNERTQLLQNLHSAIQMAMQSPLPLCAQGQPSDILCLTRQKAMIERSMHVFYSSIALGLPEPKAEAFEAEQQGWRKQRDHDCQLNGYVHEQEDQIACHTRMALERVRVYKSEWWPASRTKATP